MKRFFSPLHVLLCATALAAIAAAASTALAHEWASPPPGGLAHPPHPREKPGAWPGLIWTGPASGAPAAPSAKHCRRAPQAFEVDEAEPGVQHVRPPRADSRSMATRGSALATADSASPAELRGRALPPPAGAPMPAPAAVQAMPARPADEAVTVGMVDDNADFGEYLAYRARWPQLNKRELAVQQRVRLDVQDTRGQPVPDAQVKVYAAGRSTAGKPLPLWARTDAAGRAWLMPQPDMAGDLFEVQVQHHNTNATVMWRRGQKDVLQVRLDSAKASPAQLDLAFLIDATGSMADEIDKLKRSMQSVADQIAQLPSKPDLCFALVAYRDKGDAFFVRGADFTSDLAAFQRNLAQLQAGGGGDYPEALSEALHTAVHRLSWRGDGTARMVVLVADAPPHLDYGAPHYDHDVRGALARGIKIFGVGASGLDPQGEYIFRQAAQFTGGRFVFLTYQDASRASSGPGRETVHDVGNYSVQTLDKLVVKLVADEMAQWPRS